jgi:multiple sugar transport system substrate-binding protein
MLKKIILLIFVLFFSVGCRGKMDSEEIVFSSWGSITEVQILKQIIKDFEKENPKIKVKFMHIPQNYFQKIHLLFASNTAPDVLFMNNLNLPIYESKLEDLSDFIVEKYFYPQAVNGMSYNGKILGIPRDISNLILYVNLNKTPLPSSSWTIENLLSLAQKNTKSGQFGIGAEDDIYWATPYLSYFGSEILDIFENNSVSTYKNIRAIKFYKDLI